MLVALVVGYFEIEQICLQNCSAVKINVDQIYRQLSPGTEKKPKRWILSPFTINVAPAAKSALTANLFLIGSGLS